MSLSVVQLFNARGANLICLLHHSDNRIENIHVTMSGNTVVSAKLTDWGAYELYTMDKSASEAEIVGSVYNCQFTQLTIAMQIAFCKKHWTHVDWFVQADFE